MTTYTVSAGQTSNGLMLDSGDYATVYGTTVGTMVSSGGIEDVFSGGTASGTVVSNGGAEYIFEAGGTTVGTVVSSGGFEDVLSGTAIGTVVSNGGFDEVLSGGAASGTVVSSGGSEQVTGGTAVGTVVSNGGVEYIFEVGGTAVGTVVSSGGSEQVDAAGMASATVVSNGGLEQVFSGGIALNPVVSSGGTMANDGSLTFVGNEVFNEQGIIGGTGTLVVAGGGTTVVLSGANTYTGGTTLASGTLDLAAPGAAGSGAIAFTSGAAATLKVEAGDAPVNTLSSFAPSDTIDLAGIGLATTATLEAGNVLTVAGGISGPVTLHFDPVQSFANSTFQLANDGQGGTDLTVVPSL